MLGATIIIFVLIPETPWWLVSKGKLDRAAKTLKLCNGHVSGYDVGEHIVCFPRSRSTKMYKAALTVYSRKS